MTDSSLCNHLSLIQLAKPCMEYVLASVFRVCQGSLGLQQANFKANPGLASTNDTKGVASTWLVHREYGEMAYIIK